MHAPDEAASQDRDDSLILLLMCCHPALSPPTQIALTLRAVGGLTTADIAGAFLVPEATMAQRISRAKQGIREAGATFSMPPPSDMESRLRAVRRPARIDPAGRLVDLADQDRSLWNQSLIEEGVQLATEALQQGPPGAYQLQAAIAAITTRPAILRTPTGLRS
jgi:predicted RNA polymerase sigma factor